MKKIAAFFLIIICTISVCFAGSTLIDFTPYTSDELFDLQEDIYEELIRRGVVLSADIPQGEYIVGVDIPAGSYSVTPLTKNYYLGVFDSEGEKVVSYTSFSAEPIGKLILNDGWTVQFNTSTLHFETYTGIVFK